MNELSVLAVLRTAAGQTSQQCCDANTERMERMFRRSVLK